ncbi:MAG: uroporphyrinogen decarboxylase family protein [Thermodesulfovibrionales bacterium]
MTPREVILRALSGGRAERIPAALVGGGMWSVHHYGITFEEMAGDAVKMAGMLVEMAGRLRSDIVYVGSGYPNFPVAALGGRIKYREIGAPDLEDPIVFSEKDLAGLDMERLDQDPVMTTIREAFRQTHSRIGEEYVVTMTAWGPFTLAARLIGEEVMMKAVFKQPAWVHRVLDFATRLLLRFFEPLVRERILEVILVGDPTASGDLISRKQFEQFVVPYLKRLTDWARSYEVHTIVHICGNTTDRLDLFPSTGASCASLDHKTDMVKAKEVLHGKMCIAGNIDPVKVLLQGTVQEVEEASRRVIGAVGTEGGFILMPGCDIPPTIPYENLQRFMQVARQWQG